MHTEVVQVDHPKLLVCARDPNFAAAWESPACASIEIHRGSVLDVGADAVVSPANSRGSMGGGIDAMYAAEFPGVAERVRSEILATFGGELPVGEAVVVATGRVTPRWLFSAPTMREPCEVLPDDTVNPYLAARAVFRLWTHGRLPDGRLIADVVKVIAMPGLGTGVGRVPAELCARQVAAAWEEVFEKAHAVSQPVT